MEEAFVWTIPHFSMIKEQMVKSNVFRYHGFNWWDINSTSSRSAFLLLIFSPLKSTRPTRWCYVQSCSSRLLHVVKFWQTEHCVAVQLIFTHGFWSSSVLTDSVRLVLCLNQCVFLLLKQEPRRLSARHKFRRHWLRRHLPPCRTRIWRCPGDRRYSVFFDARVSKTRSKVRCTR